MRRLHLSHWGDSGQLTSCCDLSTSALVKSAPSMSAPVRSLRVKMARERLALRRLASLITARSMRTSERLAFWGGGEERGMGCAGWGKVLGGAV